MSSSSIRAATPATQAAPGLVLGAIGVVFGDIGTSPLYTLRECLKAAGGISQTNVFGIVSLILWSIIIVVTLKYVSFVMRADNEGEGGILALTALASGVAPQRLRHLLLTLGVFGAAMFYGDSMITPAISVISAVEGVTLVDPNLTAWIVPISLVILTGLFKIQKRGTGAVGKVFGPVMVVWFLTLAALGILHIVTHVSIVRAVSPLYALTFVSHAPGTAFVVLGSVFLALTGGEALYADMGHFGKRPIRAAWLFLVLPSLILNYFGQAALVLERPAAVAQPFFQSAPGWALIPLVLLATAATIIASQAVISGAFSMTKQAVQLGFLPRIPVVHTSTHEIGQVYVPFINITLYAAVVFLVVFFKSSDNLAAAYGIAVASTMLLTTLLMYFITHNLWHWKPLASIAVVGPLALVDAVFVSSNIGKVLDGGWFPLLAGGLLFTVMTTWYKGRETLVEKMKSDNLPLPGLIRSLCDSSHAPPRVNGTAVFPGGVAGMAPTAFLHNLKHNGVMHQTNIFLAGTTDNVPHVPNDRKVVVEDLGHGCYSLVVRHGFMEIPNVPAILELAKTQMPNWRYEPADTSFFLARDTILATGASKAMPLWREKLFAFLGRNAAQAAEYYSLPANRVVELGGQINI
ncbi:potassium transporter Kup [Paraburkholderia megapolitana]|uniref:Probable potassium transport system protein Kup n=1 Tax=Paraburkholderia megapolitana TaxID=420953 RepID=A0A1I3TZK3_9BURK|nr:potassium transporter Kup [Paraburkholderia megapolitana]QDQ83277.1 potassium transporter Kup [Paraburkholderia megapolitana]SFJ76155.1 KUP system potassium uptake protein [Paraburkholderia megapolitana]